MQLLLTVLYKYCTALKINSTVILFDKFETIENIFVKESNLL